MATVDIKFDCAPHDGTPGKPWDDFEDALMDVAAGKTDDRGSELRRYSRYDVTRYSSDTA